MEIRRLVFEVLLLRKLTGPLIGLNDDSILVQLFLCQCQHVVSLHISWIELSHPLEVVLRQRESVGGEIEKTAMKVCHRIVQPIPERVSTLSRQRPGD